MVAWLACAVLHSVWPKPRESQRRNFCYLPLSWWLIILMHVALRRFRRFALLSVLVGCSGARPLPTSTPHVPTTRSNYDAQEAQYKRARVALLERRVDDGIIMLDALCTAKFGRACARLGLMYDMAAGVPGDPGKAAALFKRAVPMIRTECEHGSMVDCTSLAYLYAFGKGVVKDVARAIAMTKTLCEAGDGPSCDGLASTDARVRDGSPRDVDPSVHYMEKGCTAGYAPSCVQLARRLKETDQVRAIALYRRALEVGEKECAAGDVYSCVAVGHLYYTGNGVDVSHERAAKYFDFGCAGGDAKSCVAVGLQYLIGEGVTPDKTRAAQLLEQACALKSEAGCKLLAQTQASNQGGANAYTRGLLETACKEGQASICTLLAALTAGTEGKDGARVLELLEKACAANDPSGCMLLATVLTTGAGGPKNPERAAQLYERACTEGVTKGCLNLALLYAKSGLKQNPKRAAQYVEKACAAGDPVGCVAVAYLYAEGAGGTKNVARAKELFEKGCEDNDGDACAGLAWLFATEKDFVRSSAFYAKACSGGSVFGCSSLGYAYQVGRGVPVDRDRAQELLDKACDGGDVYGCIEVAKCYTGKKDVAAALLRYERACAIGDAKGCRYAASVYFEGPFAEPTRAVSLFEKACANGDLFSCTSLGGQYIEGRGVKVDRDRGLTLLGEACAKGDGRGCMALAWVELAEPGAQAKGSNHLRKAVSILEKGCSANEVDDCRNLAFLLLEAKGGLPKNPLRAAKLHEKLCVTIADSCTALGLLYADGTGVPKIATKAVELYAKGCKGDDAPGCINAGVAYANGSGVAKDTAKANEFYKAACELGNAVGCAFLQRAP